MMLYHPAHVRLATGLRVRSVSTARMLPNSGDGDFYAIGISASGSKRRVPISHLEAFYPHVCENSSSGWREGSTVIGGTSPSSRSGKAKGRYGSFVSRSGPVPDYRFMTGPL
ncbi:MAG: hypothetical protein ACYTFG_00330 [Planctomycetota bacterium]|jgi:hypothetical protein